MSRDNEQLSDLRERVTTVTRQPRVILERPDLTRAAVLVPIAFGDEGPYLLLTKRTMNVATHKGQISFPGGVREPEDRDETANALREAEEEIGLAPEAVSVIGLLDDFATVTGFAVTPVVGFVSPGVSFDADPVEVAELIEAPLATLTDPDRYEFKQVEYGNKGYEFHQYQLGEHVVWGATAGIIHRFLTALAATTLR